MYIVHDKKSEFLHLYETLLHHLRGDMQTFMWLDIFCEKSDVALCDDRSAYLVEGLKPIVEELAHTVFVLSSTEARISRALQDTQILVELYYSISCHIRFEVAVDGSGEDRLVKIICSNLESLKQIFKSPDLRKVLSHSYI